MTGEGSRWIDRGRRVLGRLAVPHVTVYLVVAQLIMSVAVWAQPQLYGLMPFSLDRVLAGEVWRVFTFVVMPPVPVSMFGPMAAALFTFFALYLLYLMGESLEAAWGTYRYNAFLWIGFGVALLFACVDPVHAATNGVVMTSIFLAFAAVYPDFQILLFLILPVKIKWLAWITWGFLAVGVVLALGVGAWGAALVSVASLLNWWLYFGGETVGLMRRNRRQMARKAEAIRERDEPMHRCSRCKATDRTHPDRAFRYTRGADGAAVCVCEECAEPAAPSL